jgi:hypothetical protein
MYLDYASPGEVAEALLDLTGAPTRTIDLCSDDFQLDRFWRQIVRYKARTIVF